MASVKGVNYTLQTAVPVDHVLPITSEGRVRVLYDTYECASLAAGSTISWGKLPKGARPVDFKVWTDDLGTGVTLTLGDSGDPDRLMVATDVASAAALTGPVIADIDKFGGYEYTAETVITSLTAGGSATGTIHVYLFYVID